MSARAWISSGLLFLGLGAGAYWLAGWKTRTVAAEDALAAGRPEPMDAVTSAVALRREHRRTTTSVGTVLALRSVTLRNEVPGTVRHVDLAPGTIVEAGTVLVALDTDVEEAELKAQEAESALAELSLGRLAGLSKNRAASQMEADRALADRNVAVARIARTKAIIARKTIRAPFRARVGLSDVHPGQYLHEGTVLTTLQGVGEAVHVDFAVIQRVAAELRPGVAVGVSAGPGAPVIAAVVVAVDARVDTSTRTAMVRARLENAAAAPAPGASVRVSVPAGPAQEAVVVPVTALRRGPAGDHVFLLQADPQGQTRAHVRAVKTGALLGDEVLVLDGLAAGDQVAASGSFKLREGGLVAVTNPPAVPPQTP